MKSPCKFTSPEISRSNSDGGSQACGGHTDPDVITNPVCKISNLLNSLFSLLVCLLLCLFFCFFVCTCNVCVCLSLFLDAATSSHFGCPPPLSHYLSFPPFPQILSYSLILSISRPLPTTRIPSFLSVIPSTTRRHIPRLFSLSAHFVLSPPTAYLTDKSSRLE